MSAAAPCAVTSRPVPNRLPIVDLGSDVSRLFQPDLPNREDIHVAVVGLSRAERIETRRAGDGNHVVAQPDELLNVTAPTLDSLTL
jgi:hypothetical protein